MKTVLTAKVLNPYRRKYKWYDRLKGHTGVDLDFFNEELPAPVTGKIVAITNQKEMGKCIYLSDIESNAIHVFAHLKEAKVNNGDHVKRGQLIAITGNTGSVTSGPHLHYEVIFAQKPSKLSEQIMTRRLLSFKGWNIDPLGYVGNLYMKYNIDKLGNEIIRK